LALLHKHLYEYVRETSRQLQALIEELKTGAGAAGMLPAAPKGRGCWGHAQAVLPVRVSR
jgi:hypothetical protein